MASHEGGHGPDGCYIHQSSDSIRAKDNHMAHMQLIFRKTAKPPTIECYAGSELNRAPLNFAAVMERRLREERQAKKDRDEIHRTREANKAGIRVPHELLKDIRYDY
eukprot:10701920-Heterocapsa_arctica.AAC.1